MEARSVLVAIALAACAPSAAPEPSASPPVVITALPAATTATPSPEPELPVNDPTLETFDAVMRIGDKPERKHHNKGFQGVWLDRDDGTRLLIAYRAYGYWTPFDTKRVTVSGERYLPDGQSIAAEHFRVHTLSIDPKAGTELVRVEAEREYAGRFGRQAVAPGTKGAGSSFTTFVSGGMTYMLANRIDDAPPAGTDTRITARQVERSPFVAHVGSAHLWVIAITRKP